MSKPNIDIFNALFGENGKAVFKERLIRKIQAVRGKGSPREISCARIDKFYFFGRMEQENQVQESFLEKIEAEPQTINGDIFRDIAQILGIALDSLLMPDECKRLMELGDECKWKVRLPFAAVGGTNMSAENRPNENMPKVRFSSYITELYNQLDK